MKQSIYLLTIIILLCTSCKSEKKEDITEKQPVISKVIADSITNFPNGKRIWIALKTTDQKRVASIIGLETYETTNWKNGLEKTNRRNKIDSRVFITPVINDEWILVTGYDLPFLLNRKFEQFTTELSTAFSHFSYYYISQNTYGLVKAKDGKLERFIYYNDNSVITEKGEKSQAEKDIPLSGTLEQFRYSEKLTKEYKKSPSKFETKYKDTNHSIGFEDEVYEAYSIPWPNLDYVYKIGEQWSINPRYFEENKDYSKGLGLVGKTNFKF